MLESSTLKSFKESHSQGMRFYLGSIFFHLVLIILFLFLPQSMKNFIFGNHEQKVIREFVQVDLVGMPKLTKRELKELAPIVDISKDPVANPVSNPPEIVDHNEKTEKIDESIAPRKAPSLTSFLNTMSKKKLPEYKKEKKNSSRTRNSHRKSIKRSNKLQRLALEGNSLSRGAVSVGENSGFSDDDYQIYISSIPSQVRPFWSLPSYLGDKKLRARVKIRLDGRGRVISIDIVEASGVDEFDQRAIQAIKSVRIFTTPSKSIRELLAIKGVILGFPL